MKAMIVGGGLIDLVTLHPLAALLVLALAAVALRMAARLLAARRRSRGRRVSGAL